MISKDLLALAVCDSQKNGVKAKRTQNTAFLQAALGVWSDRFPGRSVKSGSLEFGTYFPTGVVFTWCLASRASS